MTEGGMYVIRKDLPNGQRSFKTYEGWAHIRKGVALDLSGVIRFTSNEAKASNLGDHEQFVWFGCYNEIEPS